MKNEYVIYGAGKRGKYLCDLANRSEKFLLHIFDSNKERVGQPIGSYCIESLDSIRHYNHLPFCIAIANTEEKNKVAYKLIHQYTFQQEKEISFEDLFEEMYVHILKEKDIPVCVNKPCILFMSINGLGLGGIEAWLENLVINLYKTVDNDIYILTNNESYKIPEGIFSLKQAEHGKSLSEYLLFKYDRLFNEIERHMPCTIVTDNNNILYKAACIMKKAYLEEIQLITVCHGGVDSTISAYVSNDEITDKYIGVSEDIVEAFIEKGIRADKVTRMSIPFPCEKVLNRTYSDVTPIKIGYAGRITVPQKRVDLLMNLIESLEMEGIFYQMSIAGNGDAFHELQSFIDSKNLCEKVKLLGRIDRDSIQEFWREQDICINLADYEGRSISITEAMGNGAVPVVTNTSGVKEDIEDGINGFIIPIGEVSTMCEKIKKLDQDRELLKNMGIKSHERIYPKSRLDSHLLFWKELLESVMEN